MVCSVSILILTLLTTLILPIVILVIAFALAYSIMIIPVRCFTCGNVVGNKWENYLELLNDHTEGQVGHASNTACDGQFVDSHVE